MDRDSLVAFLRELDELDADMAAAAAPSMTRLTSRS